MTPEGLAQTHSAAFGGNGGWQVEDFAANLSDVFPHVYVFGTDQCFAVVRVLIDEAEILTLATHPDAQGKSRATVMLQDALNALVEMGVQDVFLEVADDNAPARALYARCGFAEFSRRHNYYKNGATAICMKTALSAACRTDKTT